MFVPSQVPAQAASVPLQAVLGALGVPLTAMQVPTLVGSLHAWHWPAHGSLQQTPSAQDAEVHWFAVVHAWPFEPFGEHVPELQYPVAPQSTSVVQTLAHVAPVASQA